MIHFLLYFVSSQILHPGFYDQDIIEGQTISYDLNNQSFFFRFFKNYNANTENISIFVQKDNKTSSAFTPKNNIFYQLRGDTVFIHSYDVSSHFNYIITEEKACENYAFALSLTDFINTSLVIVNETRKVCYIFFEPNCDYRVDIECNSNNRNALCQIHSAESLFDDTAAISCASNNSCDNTLEDGFLITVQGQSDDVTMLDTSIRVISVKGKNSAVKCESYAIDYFDIDGIHSINKSISSTCEPAKESVVIAIVLVTVLLIILIGGVLIYYKCRPNRDAYESDEGARRKPFSKSYRRNSEAGTREPDMYTQIGPE